MFPHASGSILVLFVLLLARPLSTVGQRHWLVGHQGLALPRGLVLIIEWFGSEELETSYLLILAC